MYRSCLLGACLALFVGCASVNTPPVQHAYARAEANIPGWGAIIEVRSGQQIEATQLLDVLARAPTVMVGETHDNLAHHLIEQCCRQAIAEQCHLREVLGEQAEVCAQLSAAELDRLLDPGHYLGQAQRWVARALAEHRALNG